MIPAMLFIALSVSCAKHELDKSKKVTSSQREAAISGAMELLQTNQIKEALAITTSLVAIDADNAETQETHALALISQGWNFLEFRDDSAAEDSWERALEAYQHACRLTENPGLLQLSTGQLAQMLHNDDVAIQYYTQSHSNNIEDERASFFLSQIYLLQKDWPQAKYWLEESVKRNATEPFALISLALAEAELGNCLEALQISTKGCSILPEDPNIRFVQARVVRLCGSPQQAMEILLALPTNMQETEMFLEELNFCKQELEVD
ncbi:MAG: tetratricopeptide (TPR) repeat protein [Phycisphaerales bacterium]|jgi:tetratricopeptide (TPR) repeat protein